MVLLTIVRCLQYILLLLVCSSVLLLLFSCSVISDCDPMIRSTPGSLYFTISWSWLRLMTIQSVMPSRLLILCCLLFFFPSIFPNIRVFTNESALPISGQKFGTSTSASVIPWIAADQASLSFTISWSLLQLMSIESVMPSKHLILLSSPFPAFNLSQHQDLF